MKIGVVILTKNNFDIFRNCLESFKTYNTYKDLCFYIGDTGSDDDVIDKMKDYLRNFKYNVKLFRFNRYNFAQNNNSLIREHVEDDIILFCNDDIELKSDALPEMVENLKEDVATVGCKLLYPNWTIQHGGHLHLKEMFNVTHRFIGEPDRELQTETVDGNTFAFALTRKKTFDKVGGLDESYQKCFEDVDYCVMCSRMGMKHVFVGSSVCLHHESVTRSKYDSENYIVYEDAQKIKTKLYYHYNP